MKVKIANSIYRPLLLAPLAGPILYYIAVVAFNFSSYTGPDDYLSPLLLVLIGATPGSYLITIFAGFPLYKYLVKHDRLSRTSVGIGGAIIGGVILLIFSLTDFGSFALGITLSTNKPLAVTGVGSMVGAGVSICFYQLLGATKHPS